MLNNFKIKYLVLKIVDLKVNQVFHLLNYKLINLLNKITNLLKKLDFYKNKKMDITINLKWHLLLNQELVGSKIDQLKNQVKVNLKDGVLCNKN